VVVSDGANVFWSNDVAVPGGTLTLQSDGNLVARDSAGAVAWTSGTTAPGGRLEFTDGDLAIVNNAGSPVWTSKTKKSCWTEEPKMKAHLTSFFGLIDHGVSATMRAHVEWCMVQDRKATSGRRVLSVRQFAPTDLVARDLDNPNSAPLSNITVAFSPSDPPAGWVGEADGTRNPNSSGHYRVAATVTWESTDGIDIGPWSLGYGGKSTCTMIIHGRYFDESKDHSNDSNSCPTGPVEKPEPAKRRVVSAGGPGDGEIMVMLTPGGFDPVPVWVTLSGPQNGDGDLTLVTVQDPGTCTSIDDKSPACQYLELEIPTDDILPDIDVFPDLEPWDDWTDDCYTQWDACIDGGWPTDDWGSYDGHEDEQIQWCEDEEWAECYFF
jgi:hypothetical protein